MIKKNELISVIKINKNIQKDCIHAHQAVINECGFCWFARIGQMVKNQKINNEHNYFLLAFGKNLFLCHYSEISSKKPSFGFPEYYNDRLFKDGYFVSEYVKIDSIQEIDESLLKVIEYVGNRRKMSETLFIASKGYVRGYFSEDVVLTDYFIDNN